MTAETLRFSELSPARRAPVRVSARGLVARQVARRRSARRHKKSPDGFEQAAASLEETIDEYNESQDQGRLGTSGPAQLYACAPERAAVRLLWRDAAGVVHAHQGARPVLCDLLPALFAAGAAERDTREPT